MRVLIATRRTNGDVSNDVDYCVTGELLQIMDYCDCCRIDPDSCGCGVAFAGLNSHQMTTTAVVAEVPLSEAEVLEAIRSSLSAGGWFDHGDAELAEEMVADAWERIQQVATHFDVGTVLGRRLDHVYEREIPAPRA